MPLALLSTADDIVDIIPELFDSDNESWVRTKTEIRNAIYTQDGALRSALRLQYGTDLTCTPWGTFPKPNSSNTGDGVLSEITVAALAITEVWTLTFTSTTAFTIAGDLSGDQGTGSTGTDSVSTNAYVTIPSANWSGTPATGDIFTIRTYDIEAALVDLSSKFAAAHLLDTIFTQEVPNASEASKRWRSDAQSKLDGYLNSESGKGGSLEVGFVSRDLSPAQVLPRYIINDLGEDSSDYASGEDD